MELQDAFTNLTEKFTSGNSIPIERNTITRAEWEPICAVIAEALKPSYNSRYATALDVVQQYVKEVANSESSKFVDWLYQRLNPAERDSA